METLSILIMNWRDIGNPDAGGAEVFTHEVAKRWVQWGHEVTLLTSGYDHAVREESIDGVCVVRGGSRFTVYRRARQAYSERFRNRSDVVIDEINTRPFLAVRYVDGATPIFALIYQLAREYWFYETPFPVNVLGRYLLEERWLRPYQNIPTITISQSTKADLLALGFSDVTVVRPGLSVPPLREVPKKAQRPTIIYVGRLTRAKLPSHAIRAFEIVKKRIPSAQLWIVGDGYLSRRLRRKAPEGASFFGRVPEWKKVELLLRAHVLVFPAVREGWGLTVIEANALGTPAVGYDVPGLRDSIRSGSTGLLVPFGNLASLARGISDLLGDDDLRLRMASAALEWAGSFTWETTASDILRRIQARGS